MTESKTSLFENPVFTKIVHSRWTFVALQLLDILTTLAAFHAGGFEANPLVARFTREFGVTRGLIGEKVVALVIALGVRRRMWVVNLFYGAVVIWNVYVVWSLSARHP